MRLRSTLAGLFAVALTVWGPIAGAGASHVTCTQTLTQDTTLDGDVICPGGRLQGLRFGAPGITLDMNGFALISPESTNALTGIGNSEGHDGVRVLNGKVRGFHFGVHMVNGAGAEISDVSFELSWHFNPFRWGVPTAIHLENSPDSAVSDVTTGMAIDTGGADLITVYGSDRASLRRGTCTDDRAFANSDIFLHGAGVSVQDTRGCAIWAGSSDVSVARNEASGIVAYGDRAQVVDNRDGGVRLDNVHGGLIRGNEILGGQIRVDNSSGNTIADNRIVGPDPPSTGCTNFDFPCGDIALSQSRGNRISGNELSGSGAGVTLTSESHDTVISDNVVTRSGLTGVLLYHSDRSVIRDNRISDSGRFGIDLRAGADDSVIERNVIAHSGEDGIRIWNANSIRNVLASNDVSASGDDGIDDDRVNTIGPNTLTANSTHANADWGIEATPSTIDGGANRGWSNGQPAQCLNVVCGPGPPASLSLSPASATNTVGDRHCVTATVGDPDGRATPAQTVRFSIDGGQPAARQTDAGGTATFCYDGPLAPATQAIAAFADTDGDGAQDEGEPGDTAVHTWVLPTAERCGVTARGTITAANGDEAAFKLNFRITGSGRPHGRHTYRDPGPAERFTARARTIDSITCAEGRASVYGTALVSGSTTPVHFRIDLTEDSATYRIRLANGYDSGTAGLTSGNIQAR